MSSSLGTNALFSRVTSIEKAAEVAKKAPPKVVKLSEEASALPPHIISVTDPVKLNAQTPFFKCPPWAAHPVHACHLHCTRDGVPLPALGLDRFPFYLFGRSAVCDYVLEHPSISSIHAVLVYHREQKCFVLMDLGSTNGVKLNGVRIGRKRPVPAPVDSSIQFGFSTRMYKVRLGPPPSSKRLREEQEKIAEEQKHAKTALSSSLPDRATAAAHSASGEDAAEEHTGEAPTAAMREKARDATELTQGEATAAEVQKKEEEEEERGKSPAPPLVVERRLYHVLIKHKDVRRPVSLAPRNKGDRITRSKADAVTLARAVLARHSGPAAEWSLQEFAAAVREFSECATAKRDGDLGMVESGTYTETFDAAAFALGRGEVSAPVETELGVHLIYRAD
ncbi:peptidyl-prolyl cis-trans isomerase [Trypanosoma grayi]|uniref:peptidyl-prolyl cis-trans isomerase n=1 Tax=Trypanosoma grayi TaxID=71804 RepID=UPI0004F43375|nr:peptidyl-prolyl cis-trans isomerase [Trypanosoma grayi]KEG10470.1 peptidyl-prolyl cis-trans isomerase [Trypanosoma grayi]